MAAFGYFGSYVLMNFHQLFDAGGVFVDWALELQYQTASPPPHSNSIIISYDSSAQLTGGFVGQEGDDNSAKNPERQQCGYISQECRGVTFSQPPGRVLVSASDYTTINIPNGTRNPTRFIAEQEVYRIGNIFWCANPSNWVKSIKRRKRFIDFAWFNK